MTTASCKPAGRRALNMIRAAKSSFGGDIMGPLAIILLIEAAAAGAPIPTRTPIGTFPIEPQKTVARIEMTRVDFLPGQEMPEHMHPVPVVCVVSKGNLVASIGAAPVRKVTVGDTTIERAGEVVHYFRNASATEPAQLFCNILVGQDDKELSVMLNR
jgi:quercetin dioxygenase-like cupin family protein